MYNLTESQKNILRWLVEQVRTSNLSEEFIVSWWDGAGNIRTFRTQPPNTPDINKTILDALANADLVLCHPNYEEKLNMKTGRANRYEKNRRCMLTQKAFDAIDSDFATPDTSFVKHVTPLADVTNLDRELKDRCLPILGAGNDSKHWDIAVRQTFLILEERLRSISGLPASEINTSETLVNKVFGENSTLITDKSKRTSYRNLYSGVFTVFRNQYSHRFVDPSPEDGGAIITFVNLLLNMLEDLRPPS